jgi:putative ABC transport system permease protein
VSEEDAQALSEREGVERAEPALFHIVRVGSNPFFVLLGRRAEDIASNPPLLVDGRVLDAGAADEVMLGTKAAGNLDAAVGDVVDIDNQNFSVVGIYQTGRLYEDGGAYGPLETVQEMSGKTDSVTAVFITAAEGYDPEVVAASIEEEVDDLVTISNVGEYKKADQGVQLLDAANIAISVLAVGIGAIGVMNTMIMSVFERTREIGILRAVGWSGRRILRMVISESLILCMVAAVVGSLLGIGATRAVLLIDTVSNLLEPQYGVNVFIRALVVAVVVGLAGAAYPALRAVRLTPMEALRYE